MRAHTDQLGHRVIDGITVTGTRTTTTAPGTALGAASAVETTKEVWRDDALEMDVERTTTSPPERNHDLEDNRPHAGSAGYGAISFASRL
jgi:hypothetical protein